MNTQAIPAREITFAVVDPQSHGLDPRAPFDLNLDARELAALAATLQAAADEMLRAPSQVGGDTALSRVSAYLPPVDLRQPEAPQLSADDTLAISDFGDYLASRRLAPGTIRLRKVWAQKNAEWQLARGRRVFALRPVDVEDFAYSNPDWSDATRSSIIASLRAFYGWAARRGFTVDNLADELLPVRMNRRPSRIAKDDEIRLGLSRATVEERAMILLGAECGLRVSEIAALHRTSRDAQWLTIRGKGGKYRSVCMSPELVQLLDTIEATSIRWGFYFPGRSGSHAHPSMIWRHIRDVVGVNPHALRHRAGTVVYRETGNDIRTAQEFLGHSSPTTTAIYVHVTRSDLENASRASRITTDARTSDPMKAAHPMDGRRS